MALSPKHFLQAVILAIIAPSVDAQDVLSRPPVPATRRVSYGADPNQFADLRLPADGSTRHVVVVIHGGYWRKAYGLDHISHLCAALTSKGVATWSLEYRRIGQDGGAWPGTWHDIQAGIAAARRELKPQRLTVIGHSAGGHLTLLAAREPGVDRAISLAGVTDLRKAWELKLSRGVIAEFLGDPPDARIAQASPIELSAPRAETILIHGRRDEDVPFDFSERYAAKFASKLIALPDAAHFEVIDPLSKEWPLIEKAVLENANGPRPQR